MSAKKLLEERGHLVHEMKALTAKAAEEKRTLTAEERESFDKKDAAQTALKKQADDESRVATLEAELVLPAEDRKAKPVEVRPEVDRAEHFRNWCMGGSGRLSREAIETGRRDGWDVLNKELRLEFPRQPLHKAHRRMGALEIEKRDLSVGTTTAGGHTVPDEMMTAMDVALLAWGGVRQAATIITTDTGADLPMPTANDTSNTGELLSENSQIAEADMTFGKLTLSAYMYTSKLVQVSYQLLQDSSINVAQYLGEALGTRIGRITNTHFTTGDASSKPNGIVTAATDSTVTAASTTVLTYEEIMQLEHSVDPAYRTGPGAAWMFNDTTLRTIKIIADSNNRPLWLPGLTVGAPDKIFGYPYYINQDMAAPAASAKTMIFGDLSKYMIRQVKGVRLIRLDERYADYLQVGFFAFAEYDGDLLNAGTNPVKWLDQAAS